MNKLIRILSIICTLYTIIACNTATARDNMKIVIEESDCPVVLNYNKKYKCVWRVDFPIKLKLCNKSFLRKTLGDVRYNFNKNMEYDPHYKNENNMFVPLFRDINNVLRKTKTPVSLYYRDSYDVILYPFIKIDSAKQSQALFERYMGSFYDKDSLAIGSVKQQGILHPEFVDFLNAGELYFEFKKSETIQVDTIHSYISL